MKSIKINRRAVSPIIATLLLVAIAVAASVITYTWVMSMTGNEAQKSQTGISIDKVMFGQKASTVTSVASETTDASTACTTSVITLSTGTTNFHDGDFIQIGSGATGVTQIQSHAVVSTKMTLTVSPALSSAPGLSTTVSLVSKANGIYASVRNTGSIAATIDKVYLFQGDTLIFQQTGVNYVIPVGTAKTIGIAQSDYAYLTTGGQALPSTGSDKLIDLTSSGGTSVVNFQTSLTANNAYQLKILTNNGFQTVGTYYSPGSFT